MGKKIKRIVNFVFNCSIVIVPLVALTLALLLNTGTLWDLLCVCGILAVLGFSYKQYVQFRNKQQNAEDTRDKTAIFCTIVAFFVTALQVIFCRLYGGQILVAEGVLSWMMFLVALSGFSVMRRENPDFFIARLGLFLGFMFPAFVTLGGISDIVEHFTGYELPERMMNFLGLSCAIAVVGSLVCMVISIVHYRLVRR